jgi:hypothetical protein
MRKTDPLRAALPGMLQDEKNDNKGVEISSLHWDGFR